MKDYLYVEYGYIGKNLELNFKCNNIEEVIDEVKKYHEFPDEDGVYSYKCDSCNKKKYNGHWVFFKPFPLTARHGYIQEL